MWKADNLPEYLTKDFILSRVDEFSIYRHYLGSSLQVGCPFKSPLRQDKNPSFVVFLAMDGRLRFYDYATGQAGDCFDLLSALYGLSFFWVLAMINKDFNLGFPVIKNLKVNTPVTKEDLSLYKKEKENVHLVREPISIQCIPKNWSSVDKSYWSSYEIPRSLLEKGYIMPSKETYINYMLSFTYSKKEPMYAYWFPDSGHLKVLRPRSDKKNKWRTNAKKIEMCCSWLMPKGKLDYVFLTSSRKDSLALWAKGYPACNFQMEGANPSPEVLHYLRDKFRRVIILLDNDEAGHRATEKWKRYIPDSVAFFMPVGKDPAGFIKKHGNWLDYIIQNLIHETTWTSNIISSHLDWALL